MGGDDHDRGSPTKGDGMKPGAFDLLLYRAENSSLQRVPAPAEVANDYTDAELYRIVVAQALTDGVVSTKAEFDARVRQLGNVLAADELIAFRNLRSGCKAWRHGKRMVCDCGATWLANDVDPPHCKELPE
jgi:hypothetical protein